jgi:hypothetical protein
MQKIDEIQEISRVYKQKLLTILKSIFISEESNSETKFTIDPAITIDSLMNFQDQTKKCILSIYTNCERLFIEALILYERMYENQYGKLVDSVNEFALNSNTIGQLKNAQSDSGFGNSMSIAPSTSFPSSIFGSQSNTTSQVEPVQFGVPPSSNSQQQSIQSSPFGVQVPPVSLSFQQPVLQQQDSGNNSTSLPSFGSLKQPQSSNQVPDQNPLPSFSQSPISFGTPSPSVVSTQNNSPFKTVQEIEPSISEITTLETNSPQPSPSSFVPPVPSSPFNPLQAPTSEKSNSFMSSPTFTTELNQPSHPLPQTSSFATPVNETTSQQPNPLPNSPPLIPENSVIEEEKTSNNAKINNTQVQTNNNSPNQIKKGLFSMPSIFGTQTNENGETPQQQQKQEQVNGEQMNIAPNNNIKQSNINNITNSANTLGQNGIVEQSIEPEPKEVSVEPRNIQTQNVSSGSNVMISNNQFTQPNAQENQYSEPTNSNGFAQNQHVTANNNSPSIYQNQQESTNNAISMTNNNPQVVPETMNQEQPPTQVTNGNNSQQHEEQVVENNSAALDDEKQPNKVGGHQEMFQQIKDSLTSVFL